MITWKALAAGNVDFGRIDWEIENDPITASEWSLIDQAGLVLGVEAFDATSTTVNFSGGTAGLAARLLNVVTTASGREFNEVVRLPIYDPASAPIVSLDDAKAHLRLEVGVEGPDDPLIDIYIEAVTASLDGRDGWLGRSLRPQTHELMRDSFGCGPIRLPYGPVLGVTSVSYIDGAGDEQTVDPSLYLLTRGGVLLPAYGQSWPSTRAIADAVTIAYRAGYDGDVPAPIRAAILLMVGDLYAFRETAVTGVSAGEIPMTASARNLLSTFRLWA